MKNICFTGHRNVSDPIEITKKLIELLEELINNGAKNFYLGGALGFDMLCSITLINMKKIHPDININLILPCSNHEQIDKWNKEQKTIFYKILSSADTIEYTSECYTEECMKIRNCRLIELSECCICYYNGKFISGTRQTVHLATEKHLKIYNLISNESYQSNFI